MFNREMQQRKLLPGVSTARISPVSADSPHLSLYTFLKSVQMVLVWNIQVLQYQLSALPAIQKGAVIDSNNHLWMFDYAVVFKYETVTYSSPHSVKT
jgi:hypothetical protein